MCKHRVLLIYMQLGLLWAGEHSAWHLGCSRGLHVGVLTGFLCITLALQLISCHCCWSHSFTVVLCECCSVVPASQCERDSLGTCALSHF